MKKNLKIKRFGDLSAGAAFTGYYTDRESEIFMKLRQKCTTCPPTDANCYQAISLMNGTLAGYRDDELVLWYPEASVQLGS